MEIIIGAAISIIVQAIKKYVGSSEWITLLIVLVLSVLAAVIYAFLTVSGMWDKILPILGYAGAFYTYIIHRFEK